MSLTQAAAAEAAAAAEEVAVAVTDTTPTRFCVLIIAQVVTLTKHCA